MSEEKKKVIVLGAGISGLTAAYVLVKKGFQPIVLEKNDFVGGLAGTFSYGNHFLDYGPHNLHTHIPEVIPFIKEELGIELRIIPITSSKIYFNGKLVNYPIDVLDSLKKIDLVTGVRCFIDYITARLLLKINPDAEEDSFEDWVKNRFGKHLYNLFFGPYVERVWGISALELDAIVARKRIPEPSLLTLLLRSLTGLRLGRKHSEDPQSLQSFYPIDGIGSISHELSKRIIESGGNIELNADVTRVEFSEHGVNHIHFSQNGISNILSWDFLVNTIPINNFIRIFSAPKIETVRKDATLLTYRGTIFLYMCLSIEKISDFPWIYFNDTYDKSLIFNRIFEIRNFSEKMIHDKKGVVCLEITCYKDDGIWRKTDAELFDLCISYLERNNFLKREMIEQFFTKKIETVYPVFRKKYDIHLINVLNYLKDLGNVVSIGRQGLFSYANIDHCISMGLHLQHLVDGESLNTQKFFDIYDKFIFH